MFRGKIMINTCGTFKAQVHDTTGRDPHLQATGLALLCLRGVNPPDTVLLNVIGELTGQTLVVW